MRCRTLKINQEYRFFFLILVSGIKPTTLHVFSLCCTTELLLPPRSQYVIKYSIVIMYSRISWADSFFSLEFCILRSASPHQHYLSAARPLWFTTLLCFIPVLGCHLVSLCGLWLPIPSLCHLIRCPPVSSMLLQMTGFHSSWRWDSIPLFTGTTFPVFILPLMDM